MWCDAPNISRSKDSQTMKIGHLIKNNMGNIFLKKHTQNVLEKLVPNFSLKNQNWAYLWTNSFSVLYSLLLLYVQVEDAFTSHKAFLENKKRSGTSLPALVSALFYIQLTGQV